MALELCLSLLTYFYFSPEEIASRKTMYDISFIFYHTSHLFITQAGKYEYIAYLPAFYDGNQFLTFRILSLSCLVYLQQRDFLYTQYLRYH